MTLLASPPADIPLTLLTILSIRASALFPAFSKDVCTLLEDNLNGFYQICLPPLHLTSIPDLPISVSHFPGHIQHVSTFKSVHVHPL